MVNTFKLHKYLEKNDLFSIAEIGLNHGGDFQKAKKMIVSAASAGVSAVKFQTYNPADRTPKNRPDLKKIFSNCKLSENEHIKLKTIAEDLGLIFFSTVFDTESLIFLEKINIPLYKIASFDISNIPLLNNVSSKNKPTIISTGMASLEEIMKAKSIFDNNNCEVAFLHCVSSYPTLENESYLSNINTLKDLNINMLGISDHTKNIKVPLIAVAMGVRIIEKHLMLNNDIDCIDAPVSIEPLKFKEMIKSALDIIKIQGKPLFGIKKNEEQSVIFKTVF